MAELILEWSLHDQKQQYVFNETSSTKLAHKLRIGRDPGQCDIVFSDRSVSSRHIEIFFSTEQDAPVLKSLRSSNPPLVDGIRITQEPVVLRQGSQIQLGRIQLQVAKLIMPTIVASVRTPASTIVPRYGLKCPNPRCGKISNYDENILKQGCPWCGFSLAAANTVVIAR